MTQTASEIAAKLNRQVSDGLARNLAAMPPEKQDWRPEESTRSALQQVQECAVINGWAAEILRTGDVPPLSHDEFARKTSELDTADKAIAALRAATDDLVGVIGSLPDELLDHTIQLPWESTPVTLAEAMWISYWNMAYHTGQLAYIQTMYGDKDMH